ncbi:MAG: DUF1016 family protein [Bacilli bacterium]|nr:DUF1016 family protein [Bacilli bacterium]
MNYYNDIKNKLIDNEVYIALKDYSKENHTLITYYEVGKLLFKAGRAYGENIIGNYSKKLVIEVAKKYNPRTLRRMRQLYMFFEEQKWSPVGTKLSISHIRELFCLKDNNKIKYYVDQITKRNLSKRELALIIKNNEYERLPEETRKKNINKDNSQILDFVKSPIIVRNNKYITITEKVLQKIIMEDIENFLEELGGGFTFVKSEYPIKVGDRYNYIDLLLYNIDFNCYVVIELKVTALKKEHIGQIQVYMNYLDLNLKKDNQSQTIGIIICKKENNYIIEYCSDKRIIAKEFKIIQ